jgi:TatA/E family protein of Tat protein translocase
MDIFGIGPLELFLIIVLALIVFGPGKIPEIARQLGRTVREFKKASSALTHDFKDEFEKELNAEPARSKDAAGTSVQKEGQPTSILISHDNGETHDGSQN